MFEPHETEDEAFLRRISSIAILGVSETAGRPKRTWPKRYRNLDIASFRRSSPRRRFSGSRPGRTWNRRSRAPVRSTWSTRSGGPNTSPPSSRNAFGSRYRRCGFRKASSMKPPRRGRATPASSRSWTAAPLQGAGGARRGLTTSSGTSRTGPRSPDGASSHCDASKGRYFRLTRFASLHGLPLDLAAVQVADPVRREIRHLDLEHVAPRLERVDPHMERQAPRDRDLAAVEPHPRIRPHVAQVQRPGRPPAQGASNSRV